MPMYHSEQRQIQAARKKRPDPLVTLHPDTAKALDLTEGEWVKVESAQGSIRMRPIRLTGGWQMLIMDGGFLNVARRNPNYLAFLNQTPIFSALTDQSFAVRRSEAGLIRRCFVG